MVAKALLHLVGNADQRSIVAACPTKSKCVCVLMAL